MKNKYLIYRCTIALPKIFGKSLLYFPIFAENNLVMAEISISNKDWERVKIKIQRKYNHLTDEQLGYTQGQEEGLITKLMELVKRDRGYIIFTLKKALVNIDNNRL
jgi:hypothetical protein